MTRFLDHRLQFLAGMKSHHAAGADRNLFARFRVAAGTLRLFPGVGIAQGGESFTLSPRSRAPRISSKKASTMSLASRLFRPTFSKRRSASSAFVKVIAA